MLNGIFNKCKYVTTALLPGFDAIAGLCGFQIECTRSMANATGNIII